MPQQKEQKDIQTIFLEAFTKEILIYLSQEAILRKKSIFEKQELKKRIEVQLLKEKLTQLKEQVPQIQQIAVQQKQQKPQLQIQTTKPAQKSGQLPQIPKPIIQPRAVEISQNISQAAQTQTIKNGINFGKIYYLIQDPLVSSIECQAENRNLIIKKAGSILRTQISLTKQEIEDIIISFSERARIPLVEGLLNARVDNLEIAAVLSESANSSFIIKKDLFALAPAFAPNQMPPRSLRPSRNSRF